MRLSQDFGRNIREDVRTVRLAPERLDGLPDDYRAAHPPGDDGLVAITTDYPDLVPVHDLRRRRPRRATSCPWPRPTSPGRSTTRCSRTSSPYAARPRTLLGYDSWPDYDTEVKMIGNGAAVADFIDRISAAVQASGPSRRSRRPAGAQARRRPVAEEVESLRLALLLRARAPRAVRRRRPGRADLLRLRGGPTGPPRRHRPPLRPRVDARPRRRGRHLARRGGVATTSTSTVTRIGRIHLDLHPREGKFKHAAQFDMVEGSPASSCPRACWCATSPGA